MSEPLGAPAPGDGPRDPEPRGHGPAPDPRAVPVPVPAAADDDGDDTALRQRERAEAEAAVDAVMRREEAKARRLEAAELRRPRRSPQANALVLAALLLFNGYLWAGNPAWLTWHEPPAPSIDYYQNSYKMAVYLQRQRIEEYRRDVHHLPETVTQAGPPVRGVRYEPLSQDHYRLQAGHGPGAITFTSTDSIAAFMGRTLIELGLRVGGYR